MLRMLRWWVVGFAIAACARSSATAAEGATDRDVITEQEIASSGALNAYDAVQKLRANFLSDRGKTTILGRTSSKPTVFLDGVQFGEIQSLRSISATTVQSIRMYRSYEAQQRYGYGVTGGAIEVTTKK
jgi:hypothetical protein